MAIYLVQHGKNLPGNMDPNKGLSQEGISDVKRIAEVAGQYGIRVSKIFHSGKTRAKQTAQIFASMLHVQSEIEQIDGINPLDDVVTFSSKLNPEVNVMIVGHLPFMEKLTSFLVAGSDEYSIFRFQNGGIVCLDKEPDSVRWIIKWALMPKIG